MIGRYFVNRAALNADIARYSLIERIHNNKQDLKEKKQREEYLEKCKNLSKSKDVRSSDNSNKTK